MRPFPNGLLRCQLASSNTTCRLRPVAFRTVATDRRVAAIGAASMAATHQPVRSEHPVTVGTYRELRVLIDGYARSLLFLQAGQDSDRLKVFVPSLEVATQPIELVTTVRGVVTIECVAAILQVRAALHALRTLIAD
jgi:hypothetical protein